MDADHPSRTPPVDRRCRRGACRALLAVVLVTPWGPATAATADEPAVAAAPVPAAVPAPPGWDALDRRFTALATRDRPPARALGRVAAQLVQLRVDRADALAAEERYTEALDQLAAASKRARRAAGLGATVDVSALDARRAAMARAGAERHRTAAAAASGAGELAAALALLDAARALDPDGDDLALRAAVHRAAGDRALAEGRLEAAAARWGDARAAVDDPALARQEAALRRALAERALAAGACRAAHRLAAAHPADPDLTAVAERAAACARRSLSLSFTGGDTAALTDRAEAAARAALRERGGPHVVLDGPATRPLPSPDAPRPAPPARFEVEVATPRGTREAPTRTVQRVSAQGSVDGWLVPVVASVEEFVEPVVVQLGAAVRDPRAAGRADSLLVVGTGRAEARWAGALLGVDASDAWGRSVTTIVWGPGGDPQARRRAGDARALALDAAALAAADSLGEALATRLLDLLDREPPLPPARPDELAPLGWPPAP